MTNEPPQDQVPDTSDDAVLPIDPATNAGTDTEVTPTPKRKISRKIKLIIALIAVVSLLLGAGITFLVIENSKLKVSITNLSSGDSIDIGLEGQIDFEGVVANTGEDDVKIEALLEGNEQTSTINAERQDNGSWRFKFSARTPDAGSYTFHFNATSAANHTGSASIELNVIMPNRDETVFKSSTVVMNETGECGKLENVSCSKIISWDEKTGEVVVPKSEVFKEGSVLAGTVTTATPFGLLQKVTKVTPKNETMVLQTKPATLADAYQQLHKKLEYNMDKDGNYVPADEASTPEGYVNNAGYRAFDGSLGSANPYEVTNAIYKVPNQQNVRPVVDSDLGITIPIKLKPKDKDGDDVDSPIALPLEGEISFGLKLHFDIDISLGDNFNIWESETWKPQITFEFSQTKSFGASVEIKGALEASFDLWNNEDKLTNKPPTFPTPVPGLTVSVEAAISIKAEIDSGISMTCGYNFEQTHGVKVDSTGIHKYPENEPTDEPSDEDSGKLCSAPSQGDGATHISASVGPEASLGVMLNGGLKGLADIKGGAEVKAGIDLNYEYNSEEYVKQIDALNKCADDEIIEGVKEGHHFSVSRHLTGELVVGLEIGFLEFELASLGLFDLSGVIWSSNEDEETETNSSGGTVDLKKCIPETIDAFFVGHWNWVDDVAGLLAGEARIGRSGNNLTYNEWYVKRPFGMKLEPEDPTKMTTRPIDMLTYNSTAHTITLESGAVGFTGIWGFKLNLDDDTMKGSGNVALQSYLR